MRVLVACEFSGTVRDAFRAKGHEAYSADLLPDDNNSQHHIQCDARTLFTEQWDIMIAHPPCTRLCNSGSHWLESRNLWDELDQGAALFSDFLNAPIPHICVENPIMHNHAKKRIKGFFRQTQIIQPWQHGHGEQKSTCLWLKGLPPLQPSNIVAGRYQKTHFLGPVKDRWKIRSKTYEGIAKAMAEQWSELNGLFELL